MITINKIKLFVTIIVVFLNVQIKAQLGCTDQIANNYSALATTNNGSCTYNTSYQIPVEVANIAAIVPESSGAIYDNGFIYTHGDSGSDSKIFKIDAISGALIQTINVSNFTNVDWEEITVDANNLYIGDFGNNLGTRTNLKVLKVSKSQFINNNSTTVNVIAEAINFSYADQTNFTASQLNNFDCEAMVSIGNFIYLFTKNRVDGQTKVYKLSKTVGTYSLAVNETYNVAGLITGATYNQNTNELALLGYLPPNGNSSFIYYLNDFNSDLFFSGNIRRVEIGNSANAFQTEAICFKNNNELFITCETTTFSDAKLFLLNKNNITLTNKDFLTSNNVALYPNPVTDDLHFESNSEIKNIIIFTSEGKKILEKNMFQKSFTLQKSFFKQSGYYLIQISSGDNISSKKIIIP